MIKQQYHYTHTYVHIAFSYLIWLCIHLGTGMWSGSGSPGNRNDITPHIAKNQNGSIQAVVCLIELASYQFQVCHLFLEYLERLSIPQFRRANGRSGISTSQMRVAHFPDCRDHSHRWTGTSTSMLPIIRDTDWRSRRLRKIPNISDWFGRWLIYLPQTYPLPPCFLGCHLPVRHQFPCLPYAIIHVN